MGGDLLRFLRAGWWRISGRIKGLASFGGAGADGNLRRGGVVLCRRTNIKIG